MRRDAQGHSLRRYLNSAESGRDRPFSRQSRRSELGIDGCGRGGRSCRRSRESSAYDRMLRASDLRDGKVVWSSELPAGPQATPMIYQWDGAVHVTLTLGGLKADGEIGDYVVTYRLSSNRNQ